MSISIRGRNDRQEIVHPARPQATFTMTRGDDECVVSRGQIDAFKRLGWQLADEAPKDAPEARKSIKRAPVAEEPADSAAPEGVDGDFDDDLDDDPASI